MSRSVNSTGVARVSPDARLRVITQAGAGCFARVGYRRTKMADVATAAGVSSGALYTYVESKEALFHLVLAQGFGLPAPDPASLPVETPELDSTVEMVGRERKRLGVTPVLDAALAGSEPADLRAELSAIVEEQYSMIERLRGALTVIEACAADIAPLEQLYYGRRRRGHIDRLSMYIQKRAATGRISVLPDMAVAAQIVTETIAWFAWKRHEGHDSTRFDDGAARKTVVAFICHALLGAV
jgi:AcrR family transcriptional regulator